MNLKRSLTGIALATIVLVSLCAVCASTSVRAATSSSPTNIQNTPVGKPLPEGSSPAACSQDANSLDLFVRGSDNQLWWMHWSAGRWGVWQPLGGVLTSSPAAVSRQNGTVDVYVRGANGAVYQKAWDSVKGWLNWINLGGQLAPNTGPAAAGQSGREDVFVVGTNGALYWKSWNPTTTWSGWRSLGGKLTASPGASSYGTDAIIVLARGTNGACYVTVTTDGGTTWDSWRSLGGQILAGTGPAVASLNEFVTGTNHQLYWYQTRWESVGGYLTSSAAATVRASRYVEVFVRGGNGLIYLNEYSESGGFWRGWSTGMDGPP